MKKKKHKNTHASHQSPITSNQSPLTSNQSPVTSHELPVTNNQSLKIMTIIGTRPEIIRLSRTMALLDKYVNQVIVHTGQNYDYELTEVFWDDLELRKPDYFLDVDRSSLGGSVGDIIRKSEEVMKKENPDGLLVLGDTNSCLSAYMAKRLRIPIFHMEAGNRSFDFNVPEEINRRIIDHIADFNLVYTEHARRHLLSEGLQHRRIYLTGSPMKEVLDYYKPKIEKSDILTKLKLKKNEYFVVSTHREENVDNPENLQKIIEVLNQLAERYNKPIIVSTHPRTRKRLEELKNTPITNYQSRITSHQSPVTNHQSPITSDQSPVTNNQSPVTNHHLRFLKPFGFLDYINLQMNALCAISDSGTISEESAMLEFPAISLRQSMERPEAQDTGSIILSGLEPDIVLNAVKIVIDQFNTRTTNHTPPITNHQSPVTNHQSPVTNHQSPATSHQIPADYQITNTSWRVLKLILGNTKLSNKWWGIKK